jgi:hypothetical protein
MRAFYPTSLLLLVVTPVAAIASVNKAWQSPARPPQVTVGMEICDGRMLDSLREDVARHPDDFVSFQTQSTALRFIDEHGVEANRETARWMIERGVLGYWLGKMVVVVPIRGCK